MLPDRRDNKCGGTLAHSLVTWAFLLYALGGGQARKPLPMVGKRAVLFELSSASLICVIRDC